MIFKLRINGYNVDNAKPTKLTARFNEDGLLLNPRDVAKSSQLGWGAWQQSQSVNCSYGYCYWCSTAGHGGYILVTQLENEELPAFKDPAMVIDHEWNGKRFKFKVFEFEEDCDWAILLYYDRKARQDDLTRINFNRRFQSFSSILTEGEHLQEIVNCLNRWNAWVVEKEQATC